MDSKITLKPNIGMQTANSQTSEAAERKTSTAGMSQTADVLENASRPHFFSGRLLTAEDFQQDQSYNTEKQDARYVRAANNLWNCASVDAKNRLMAEGSNLRTELPKLTEEAGDDSLKLHDAVSARITHSLQANFQATDFSNLDIGALVIIVLMEATRSAQEDLTETLAQIEKSRIALQFSNLSVSDIVSKVQLDFPDLTGDDDIKAENIRAKEAIEYSFELEKNRIKPTEDPDD